MVITGRRRGAAGTGQKRGHVKEFKFAPKKRKTRAGSRQELRGETNSIHRRESITFDGTTCSTFSLFSTERRPNSYPARPIKKKAARSGRRRPAQGDVAGVRGCAEGLAESRGGSGARANLKVILTSARAPRKGFRRIVTGL